jgi:biotin carboxyl carrier protein
LTLRVEVDGQSYTLKLQRNGSASHYSVEGGSPEAGTASVVEVKPDVFSVLLGHKSFTVFISERDGALEAFAATQRHVISIADARDRSAGSKKVAAAGPVEIRAQMPGKVIKLLVHAGAAVQAGQGVIVVEAMKMQNEMKSPKAGVVSRIRVQEGATVAAGETMMVVE